MSNSQPVNLFASLDLQEWRDPALLDRLHTLSIQNVYLYFQQSQFFIKECNNEILRQQQIECSAANLRELLGCEYQIREIPATAQSNSIFLIYQQNRRSRDSVEVIQIYCVLGGTVYPMPTLHDVFANHLLHYTHLMSSSLNEIERIAQYNTAANKWEFNATASKSCSSGVLSKSESRLLTST
jgi:hypothetical protein